MRILLVEDEPKIRDVIIAYLQKEGWEADDTPDGYEAVRQFDLYQHDLVILDLMLEGLNGEEVCKRIREKSKVPIIMLTAKTRESDTINGLNLGADDYVTKPFRVKELIARIHALLRRTERDGQRKKTLLSFQDGKLTVNTESREIKMQGNEIPLTGMEFKLLSVLAGKPGKIFSRPELFYLVTGTRFMGDSRVIDSHIKNLRKKIEADFHHPEYIVTVIGSGYKFAAQPDE